MTRSACQLAGYLGEDWSVMRTAASSNSLPAGAERIGRCSAGCEAARLSTAALIG